MRIDGSREEMREEREQRRHGWKTGRGNERNTGVQWDEMPLVKQWRTKERQGKGRKHLPSTELLWK